MSDSFDTMNQASLSITNSRSPPKPMCIELVMPSNHLIFCHPLLLLSSVFPGIRVFSNESALRIRQPKYWSFPGGSEGKVSACNAGDLGSTPGLRRCPGEGNSNPLQYSCLENPKDGEACRLQSMVGYSLRGCKDSDTTGQLHSLQLQHQSFNEHSGLISFRMDWFNLLAVQGTQESSPTPQFKSINSSALSFVYSPTFISIHDHWKNQSLD